MAILFSETWTAAGGDNAWSQTADADCTIDEDAASSLAGSPPGWGAKCLKCDVVGGETVRKKPAQYTIFAAISSFWISAASKCDLS